jgi:hypothetical protein
MLIQVPELIQDPECLAGEGIASVMGLKVLDDFSGVWMNCPDSLVQLLLSGSSRPVDRKFAALSDLFGKWASRVGPGEGENELVKGRPQIVDAVSRDQRYDISGRNPRSFDDNQVIAGFGIGLLSNEIRVDIEPFLNGKVQVLQVEACPIHLELEAG